MRVLALLVAASFTIGCGEGDPSPEIIVISEPDPGITSGPVLRPLPELKADVAKVFMREDGAVVQVFFNTTEPEEELCNGEDEDLDGEIDEGREDPPHPWGTGTVCIRTQDYPCCCQEYELFCITRDNGEQWLTEDYSDPLWEECFDGEPWFWMCSYL